MDWFSRCRYLWSCVTGKTESLAEQVRQQEFKIKTYEEEQRTAAAKALIDERFIANIPVSEEDRFYFKKIRGHSSWSDQDIQKAIFASYETSLSIDIAKIKLNNAKTYGIAKNEE